MKTVRNVDPTLSDTVVEELLPFTTYVFKMKTNNSQLLVGETLQGGGIGVDSNNVTATTLAGSK